MREVYRLAALALILSCTVVFVAVPAVALALGLSDRIFIAGPMEPGVPLLNLVALSPLLLAWAWTRTRADGPISPSTSGVMRVPAVLAVVLVWCTVYLLSGGMEYRETDLYEGYAARSPLLRVAQILSNSVMVLAAAVNLGPRPFGRQAVAALLCLLLPLASFAGAGGRGLVVQLLLTCWIARYLWHAEQSEPVLFDSAARDRQHATPERRRSSRRLMTWSAQLGCVLGVVVLAWWGARRDNVTEPLSIVFFTLLRAAEPYWHHAWTVHQAGGVDLTVLTDVLDRVLSIPGRWMGFEYASSVDGAERILQYRLNIPYVEGISLPITFFGEGMLFAGHPGAAMFSMGAAVVALVGIYAARSVPIPSRPICVALLAQQVVKCLLVYPKSLSGIVLVMIYETGRDALLLVLISYLVVRRGHTH